MRPQKYWHGLLANVFRDLDHFVSRHPIARPPLARMTMAKEDPGWPWCFRTEIRSIRTFLRLNAVARWCGGKPTESIACRKELSLLTPPSVLASTARTIIADRDGLTIRNGIYASRRKETEQLARLIADAAGIAAANARAAVKPAMKVSRPSMRQPLPLVVAPMRFDEISPQDHLAVSITISDPERLPETTTETLARLYGLTASEAKLASLLICGDFLLLFVRR